MSSAESDNLLCADDYLSPDLFNPKVYLELVWPVGEPHHGIVHTFNKRILQFLHNTLSSGRFHGDNFLDVCSGPSIHGTMSASKYFRNILLTEFGPQNRAAIQTWMNASSEAYDWTYFFEMVASFEGQGATAQDVERRTRERIREVVACDLSQEVSIDPQMLSKYGSMDVVYSSLTLEAVAKDSAEYSRMLAKLASYLRQGGGLLLCGTYGQSFYSVGSHKFHSLDQDETAIRKQLEAAGFSVEEHIAYGFDPNELPDPLSVNANQYFCIVAVKN